MSDQDCVNGLAMPMPRRRNAGQGFMVEKRTEQGRVRRGGCGLTGVLCYLARLSGL